MISLLDHQAMPHAGMISTNAPPPPVPRAVEEGVRAAIIATFRLKKVLVTVDFSSGSLRTLDHAAALAGRFGSRVSLLHVVEPVQFVRGLGDVSFVSDEEGAEHAAGERLSRWMKGRTASAIPGEPLVRRGRLVRQIMETARSTDTDLIVLSRAHRRGWQRLLAPSRLKRIVRRAICPTLIVPESFLARHPRATLGRRVLVPVDGSERSRSALGWGAALVEPIRGSLSVFYVPGLYEAQSGNGSGPDHELRARTAEALEQRLWAWAKETVPPALRVIALREVGVRAAEALAVMATREHSDLIVLCSRCVCFWQRLLDACLTEQLAWVASCPVLCLPEPTAGRFQTVFDAPSRARVNHLHLGSTTEDPIR
jgi:nucleotide-binding universal stress UspA family protein